MQRFGKVLIADLEIVLSSHCLAVADPRADDVCWEAGFQFRLPTGSEVVEDSRPRDQAGAFDNLGHHRAEVAVQVAVAVDDMHLAGSGTIASVFQIRQQFGEQWHNA
ncbi:MAG: hypothetical protein NT013_00520 [Planctomycetia bacterium]|nr:hypothetical protein [Planctomycetia bacterium]